MAICITPFLGVPLKHGRDLLPIPSFPHLKAVEHVTKGWEAEGIVLRAQPVHVQHRVDSQRAGFKVMLIESGSLEWGKLCYVPQW